MHSTKYLLLLLVFVVHIGQRGEVEASGNGKDGQTRQDEQIKLEEDCKKVHIQKCGEVEFPANGNDQPINLEEDCGKFDFGKCEEMKASANGNDHPAKSGLVGKHDNDQPQNDKNTAEKEAAGKKKDEKDQKEVKPKSGKNKGEKDKKEEKPKPGKKSKPRKKKPPPPPPPKPKEKKKRKWTGEVLRLGLEEDFNFITEQIFSLQYNDDADTILLVILYWVNNDTCNEFRTDFYKMQEKYPTVAFMTFELSGQWKLILKWRILIVPYTVFMNKTGKIWWKLGNFPENVEKRIKRFVLTGDINGQIEEPEKDESKERESKPKEKSRFTNLLESMPKLKKKKDGQLKPEGQSKSDVQSNQETAQNQKV